MPEPKSFNASAVLIAGGTSGTGLATAMRFAQAGVKRVGLLGRNPDRGAIARQAVADRFPGITVEYYSADTNSADAALAAADWANTTLGGVDILVNATVGVYVPDLFHRLDIQSFGTLFEQQLLGPLNMCRAVIDIMREQKSGVIINIASDAGKMVTPGETLIGAAMAGIVMFSRTLAIEAKRDGIRVNAITPSLIQGTLAYDRSMNDGFSGKLFAKAVTQAHLGLTDPEDLAELIVFLASPAARRITGQVVSVNGGISV